MLVARLGKPTLCEVVSKRPNPKRLGHSTFYEGCMTKGLSTDAADDLVQANVVAVGYRAAGV